MTRFRPADYPAYTFNPETGSPIRHSRPRRGPYASHPGPREVPPVIRKSDGRECFHLQRADGKYRLVSRDLILVTLNPWAERPAPEPATLPPWSFDIAGFAGYAVVLNPFSVIRFDSPASGPINPPTVLKASERRKETLDRTYVYYTYSMIDENTGRRRQVQAEKVMELAGVTPADIAAAHARHLETRTPNPHPAPPVACWATSRRPGSTPVQNTTRFRIPESGSPNRFSLTPEPRNCIPGSPCAS